MSIGERFIRIVDAARGLLERKSKTPTPTGKIPRLPVETIPASPVGDVLADDPGGSWADDGGGGVGGGQTQAPPAPRPS